MVIDCKTISYEHRAELKQRIDAMKRKPGLAVIVVGNNAASMVYVRNKIKACKEVGIYSQVCIMRDKAKAGDVIDAIHDFTLGGSIDGIIVQLPLPKHIDEFAVVNEIHETMDVDALTAVNAGKLMQGNYDFAPCTPKGIISILHHKKINMDGANCVIIGRSDIVGKPMAHMMMRENATVTVCHSHTKNLPDICKQADIVIAAVGKAGFVTADMVKDGATVIDVGINRDANGKLVGDVDFENVSKKASFITPVPGGVGLMTVTSLLENTYKAACLRENIKL